MLQKSNRTRCLPLTFPKWCFFVSYKKQPWHICLKKSNPTHQRQNNCSYAIQIAWERKEQMDLCMASCYDSCMATDEGTKKLLTNRTDLRVSVHRKMVEFPPGNLKSFWLFLHSLPSLETFLCFEMNSIFNYLLIHTWTGSVVVLEVHLVPLREQTWVLFRH